MKIILPSLLSLLVLSPLSHAGELVDYSVNGLSYEGYFTSNKQNAPLILVLHDWDGLTDYEIKRSEMLADAGYAVFAADLFGKGIRPTEVKDKREHTGELYQNREKMRALLEAAVKTAGELGADVSNIVVMGYCFGGAAALEYARSGMPARGVVTFHGGLSTPEGQSYENTQAEILIFHGSADTLISLQDFAQLGSELEAAKVPHEMITYGGAPHSFTVFNSGAYDQESDTRSWARFMDFLKETLPSSEKTN